MQYRKNTMFNELGDLVVVYHAAICKWVVKENKRKGKSLKFFYKQADASAWARENRGKKFKRNMERLVDKVMKTNDND